jgi:hypothetical protein
MYQIRMKFQFRDQFNVECQLFNRHVLRVDLLHKRVKEVNPIRYFTQIGNNIVLQKHLTLPTEWIKADGLVHPFILGIA